MGSPYLLNRFDSEENLLLKSSLRLELVEVIHGKVITSMQAWSRRIVSDFGFRVDVIPSRTSRI